MCNNFSFACSQPFPSAPTILVGSSVYHTHTAMCCCCTSASDRKDGCSLPTVFLPPSSPLLAHCIQNPTKYAAPYILYILLSIDFSQRQKQKLNVFRESFCRHLPRRMGWRGPNDCNHFSSHGINDAKLFPFSGGRDKGMAGGKCDALQNKSEI